MLDLETLLALPIQLRAETLIKARWLGQEKTSRLGLGGDFRELRPYQPGDSLRRIDWRVSARSTRLFVKQTDQAAHVRCIAWLDPTKRMLYPVGQTVHKAAIAKTLVAAIGLHAIEQQAAFSIWDDDTIKPLLKMGKTAQQALWQNLNATPIANEKWPTFDPALLRQTDIVLIISDWLGERSIDHLAELSVLTQRGIEVRALQVLHSDEYDFPFRGRMQFHALDAVNTAKFDLSAHIVAQGYRENIKNHLATLKKTAQQARVAWHCYISNQPLSEALQFLARGLNP